MFRSPLVEWVYGQTFTGIVMGSPAALVFQDCDAWAERPGESAVHTSFFGETADLVERMTLADPWLGDALDYDPRLRYGDRYAILSDLYARQCDFRHLRALLAVHLAGDTNGNLCDDGRKDRVRLALTAWKETLPFPVGYPDPRLVRGLSALH